MKLKYWVTTLAALGLLLSACASVNGNNGSGALTASGTIAAKEVGIAAEIGGKVIEVNVEEGDTVQAGDVLFRVDDALLQAQAAQARAAVDSAAAAVGTARAQLNSAQAQYDLAAQGARLQDMQNRAGAWSLAAPLTYPAGVNLPNWYFDKTETLAATQAAVGAAQAALKVETANLAKELQNASNDDFVAAEERLAQAQVRYTIAQQTLAQAQAAQNKSDLEAAAQQEADAAQSELTAAQLDYDRMLSTSAAQAVLEARARAAVATARFNNAQDALARLQTGAQSLQVEAARQGVELAGQAVTQAEAGQAQAEAALTVLQLQLDKAAVRAPIAGIVLARNLEAGELVGPGSKVLVIGQLDEVRLTVYIPEDKYGQVKLGQNVTITADSFPGQSFEGSVVHIADQAEFTPRNVQTVEGRKATVYAVEVRVPNLDHKLKPGMPTDVAFSPAP